MGCFKYEVKVELLEVFDLVLEEGYGGGLGGGERVGGVDDDGVVEVIRGIVC